MKKEVIERIEAHGHSSVTARHKKTFEFTKEEHLTSKGDCILAVGANKGARELSDEFKTLAARGSTRIIIMIEVDGVREIAVGRGDASLTFTHETDIVARKSNFTCGRTVMTRSNMAAADFSRVFTRRLKNPDATVYVTLVAQS